MVALLGSRARLVLGLIASALLASIIISPKPIMDMEKPTLDAASYLSHAFTLGLDRDMDYSNEPYDPIYFNDKTGMPSHPIGPGLMASPFVAGFSILDAVSGHPVLEDHSDFLYSWSRYALYFSGVVYFLLGIWLYIALGRRLAPALHPIFVLLPALGSGVVYYVFHDGYLGHSFQFFAFALVAWASASAVLALRDGRWAWPFFALMLLGELLALLVRPADLNVLLLPVLIALALSLCLSTVGVKSELPRRFVLRYVAAALVGVAALAAVYFALYGTALPTPSDMYGDRYRVSGAAGEGAGAFSVALTMAGGILSRLDYIPAILFSSEFGLLFTAPIIVLGIVVFLLSIPRCSVSDRAVLVALLLLGIAYVGLPVAVVLHWKTTASAYGWRYLFSLVPLGFVGLFLSYAIYSRGTIGRQLYKGFLAVLAGLSMFAVLSQSFWGTSSQLHFHVGENIFGVYHGTDNDEYPCCSGLGYLPKLVDALGSPGAWVAMAAHRFPGFVGVTGLRVLGVDVASVGAALGIPPDKLETGLARYSAAPVSAVMQLFLVFVLTTAAIWYLGSSGPKERPQRTGPAVAGDSDGGEPEPARTEPQRG